MAEILWRTLPPAMRKVWRDRYRRVLAATNGCEECAERAALEEVERRGVKLEADGTWTKPCASCGGR